MVEKRVKKFGHGSPPPFSGNARKKTFFLQEGFPKLWLAMGWKVLVHLPPRHLAPHILGHLPLHSMDQVLDEKAVNVS